MKPKQKPCVLQSTRRVHLLPIQTVNNVYNPSVSVPVIKGQYLESQHLEF